MTDKPHEPQPSGDLAASFAEAWSAWVKAATAAFTGPAAATGPGAPAPGRLDQLTAAFSGYAGAASAPLRDLASQQRELATSMEEWARLQRALADHVQTWAEHQHRLADTLDAMLAPLALFTRPPE